VEFRVVGPEDAPTVVLLHGGGVGGWSWEPVLPHLAAYRCLVPDLPGHGASRSAGPFLMRGAAHQVAALIRAQAPHARAHVVGLSLGAQVGVELLASAPTVVRRAVLSGALVRPLRGAALIRPLVYAYMPVRNAAWLVRANMRSLGIPERYFARFAEDTRQTSAAAMARILGANAHYRLTPALASAQAPTLVVVGEREHGVMRDSARDLVRTLPCAEGRVAADMGHNWSFQAPERFAAMVRAWIEQQPLPAWLQPLV
jgi:pimeloyl-ACP methyl ester carboxylesterase